MISEIGIYTNGPGKGVSDRNGAHPPPPIKILKRSRYLGRHTRNIPKLPKHHLLSNISYVVLPTPVSLPPFSNSHNLNLIPLSRPHILSTPTSSNSTSISGFGPTRSGTQSISSSFTASHSSTYGSLHTALEAIAMPKTMQSTSATPKRIPTPFASLYFKLI